MKKGLLLLALSIFCVYANAQYQEGVIVEKLLQTDTTVIGQKIVYPAVPNAEVTMAKVIVPAGKQTGWHKHEIPVFAYMIKGTLTVELENGDKAVYRENETISEVFNTYHNGYNASDEDVVLIAIYLGEKGKPLSEKKDSELH
jgi:quercetin dioxygenase-like cupin family protein